MTNKKRGVVLIAAGAALLLAALFLIFANFREADKADKTAETPCKSWMRR